MELLQVVGVVDRSSGEVVGRGIVTHIFPAPDGAAPILSLQAVIVGAGGAPSALPLAGLGHQSEVSPSGPAWAWEYLEPAGVVAERPAATNGAGEPVSTGGSTTG